MAGKTAKKARPKTGVLTKVVILVLLAAIGWRLYALRSQIETAREGKAQLEAVVSEQERENAALKEDLEQGPTSEKMEEIARDKLGLVKPGEYVFDTGE